MGGDEFVVFVMGRSPAWVEESIGLLRSTTEACNRLPGRSYELSLSIGLTHYPSRPPHDIQGLIERADNSMYRAKQESADRRVRPCDDSPAQDSGGSEARVSITNLRGASR
jgi:GGDEF domain-containing protein